MLIDIFFQFSPSYWYRNYGISLKKDFYSNEEKRLKIKERMRESFIKRYPSIPEKHFFLPMGPSINLQPFIIYMGILGAKIKYFDDLDPWAEEPIIGKVMSFKEFETFSIEKSPFFHKMTINFDYLSSRYEPMEVDLFGKGEIANIHSPITTAQKVLGTTEFFIQMMDNPSYLHRVLDKIAEHYIFILDYFAKKKGVKIKHVHFGDCVSFSLPGYKYEEFGIIYKNKIINHFEAESSDIHSCGKSDHLLQYYVTVDNLKWFEVAVETDWQEVKSVCQQHNLKYIPFLLNPKNLQRMNSKEASSLIAGILEKNYPVDTVIRTGAMEYGTPDENILAMHNEVVSFINGNGDADFIPPHVKVVW